MKLVLLNIGRIIILGYCGLLLPGAPATATAAAASARERISRYVEAGQMFAIQDPDEVAVLLETPNAPDTPGGNVKWFCSPTYAPDTNGDGYYDNVVGHMLTFRPPKEMQALNQQGFETESKGSWHPGGFTTAWANDHYNEYLVSYGNQRIGQFMELIRDDDDGDEDSNATTASSWFSSYVHLEFFTPTDTQGFTASTVLEWSFNATSDPRLVEMAANLGKELTGTTCEEKYAEVWSALKNTPSSSSSKSSSLVSTSERGMITTTLAIMIITTISSLFFMVNHL